MAYLLNELLTIEHVIWAMFGGAYILAGLVAILWADDITHGRIGNVAGDSYIKGILFLATWPLSVTAILAMSRPFGRG